MNGDIQSAVQKGYEIVKAGPVEVGLLKNGQPCRTWWIAEFDGKMPTLAHPQVQAAITIQEYLEGERKRHESKSGSGTH